MSMRVLESSHVLLPRMGQVCSLCLHLPCRHVDRFVSTIVLNSVRACMRGKSLQSCLTLCDPMDCSPPGPSVHGILQARILEWVAISFSSELHTYVLLYDICFSLSDLRRSLSIMDVRFIHPIKTDAKIASFYGWVIFYYICTASILLSMDNLSTFTPSGYYIVYYEVTIALFSK